MVLETHWTALKMFQTLPFPSVGPGDLLLQKPTVIHYHVGSAEALIPLSHEGNATLKLLKSIYPCGTICPITANR